MVKIGQWGFKLSGVGKEQRELSWLEAHLVFKPVRMASM